MSAPFVQKSNNGDFDSENDESVGDINADSVCDDHEGSIYKNSAQDSAVSPPSLCEIITNLVIKQ